MLKQLKQRWESGDTLVEVLFAITVFSLVVVTSLALMNQGTAASVRSLQMTLVRQQIDSQAETLRFLNSAYIAAYYPGYSPNTSDASTSPAEEYFNIIQAVRLKGATSVTAFGGNTGTDCKAAPSGSFIMNTRTARYQAYSGSTMTVADGVAEVTYDSANGLLNTKGMWIEAVRSAPSGGTSYTDFHIRACWAAPGLSTPLNLGTIVRLYEPTA